MPSVSRLGLVVVLLFALGAGAPSAGARPDLAKTLNQLHREKDPQRRIQLLRRLGAMQGNRAAKALADLVMRDPAAGVRFEAARALGRITADDATSLLVGLVRAGGPRAVRQAVGEALGRRKDGISMLRKALASSRTRRQDRGLLLRALGYFRGDRGLDDLELWATDADPFVAGQAVQALLDRADDLAERRALVTRLLKKGRSIEQLMPALDAADTVLDASLERFLERAASFREPSIREAAEHLLDQLRALPSAAPAAQDAQPAQDGDDRYAAPEAPTPSDGPPPVSVFRGRTDTVYVLDATGSTDATLPMLKERILSGFRVLLQAGVNARVGVLLYRGGKRGARTRSPFEILPLTYDIQELRAWLDDVEPHGVDDRGLRIGEALRAALARSAWRWRARRVVHLLADGPCGDRDVAMRAVTLHFRADRTRTRITYVARTRNAMPMAYEDLARRGGTGEPEVLR